mmetsp:Transcript_3792/g.11745  ORF Transcript_3792/g.11745 Transcript_3792/m.11745 type:complete len:222 (+) Transcript_3792:481-1146(+)
MCCLKSLVRQLSTDRPGPRTAPYVGCHGSPPYQHRARLIPAPTPLRPAPHRRLAAVAAHARMWIGCAGRCASAARLGSRGWVGGGNLVLVEVDAILLGRLVNAVLVDRLHRPARELHPDPAVELGRIILLGVQVDRLLARGHAVRERDRVGVVRASARHLALLAAVRAHRHVGARDLRPHGAHRRREDVRIALADGEEHREEQSHAHSCRLHRAAPAVPEV